MEKQLEAFMNRPIGHNSEIIPLKTFQRNVSCGKHRQHIGKNLVSLHHISRLGAPLRISGYFKGASPFSRSTLYGITVSNRLYSEPNAVSRLIYSRIPSSQHTLRFPADIIKQKDLKVCELERQLAEHLGGFETFLANVTS